MMSMLGSHFRRNLVAYLALFVALGGTAVAAKPMLTGADIQDGSLTDADVAAINKDGEPSTLSLRTLGKGAQQAMPGNATPSGSPTGAAGGDLSGNYPNPDIAAGAVTAAKLAPPDPWNEVGDGDGPPFSPNPDPPCAGSVGAWENVGQGFSSAAFYRDPFGTVHLKGVVAHGSLDFSVDGACSVFVLPNGYRPAAREIHTSYSAALNTRIDIHVAGGPGVAGAVAITNGGPFISLDGISFRCAPSGSNGCP